MTTCHLIGFVEAANPVPPTARPAGRTSDAILGGELCLTGPRPLLAASGLGMGTVPVAQRAVAGDAGPTVNKGVQLYLEDARRIEGGVQEPLELQAVHEGIHAAGFDFELLVVHRQDLAQGNRFLQVADPQFDRSLVALYRPFPGRVLRVRGLCGQCQEQFDEPRLRRVVEDELREATEVLEAVSALEEGFVFLSQCSITAWSKPSLLPK